MTDDEFAAEVVDDEDGSVWQRADLMAWALDQARSHARVSALVYAQLSEYREQIPTWAYFAGEFTVGTFAYGLAEGYPRCCVAAFCRNEIAGPLPDGLLAALYDHDRDVGDRFASLSAGLSRRHQAMEVGGLDYVPCDACAARILAGSTSAGSDDTRATIANDEGKN